MKPTLIDISSLEEKHLISILLYLNMNPRCKKMDIYEEISSNPRIPDKLNKLEDMGLIIQTDDEETRSKVIILTKKGAIVAKKLAEMDQMLKQQQF